MSATSKLGSLLRRLRKENNLTQAQVAEKSGLARVHIANLETGKRGGGRIGWDTVNGLANAFGVSPDEFAKMLETETPRAPSAKRGRPRKTAEPAKPKRTTPRPRKGKK